ncbi:protein DETOXIFICATION 18 [Sesamum alatum]|uniref:Protein DETOXIFICATION n=1 Tax=Sesamum alatum TaxID=300844 RepID=A0AAE2CYD7_9LAMI|nr:protein DETOXIFICATION 18 [Sesamum alatum]
MESRDGEIYVPLNKAAEEEEGPRLESGGAKAGTRRRRWWYKSLEGQEAKDMILLSMPMILTNVCYDSIPLVSVMFAGHLGEEQLAASNLANSWASITGFTFLVGLSGALDTLCGQDFGAKLYKTLGIHLQASCILSFFFTTLVSILWWHSDTILTILHQDPQISKQASLYLKYLIPGLFAYGFLENILRFLQMQSVAFPLVGLSLMPLIIHVGVAYALAHCTDLGFKGAALAASISLWIAVIILGLYILHANRFKDTWSGFSWEPFYSIFANLKLALVSAAMACLDEWAFELLVLLAGLMPNSTINTSLIAMCASTENFSFMLSYGLGAAVSTRMSNELGAEDPGRARRVMTVALKLTTFVALAVILVLVLGAHVWAGLFTNSPVIVAAFSSMTPLLALSIMLDFIQATLSGVTRGCGWQQNGAWINLTTFYLIGMPLAVLLGFKLKLYAEGLWIGFTCGLGLQVVSLLWLTRTRIKLPADPSTDILEEQHVANYVA